MNIEFHEPQGKVKVFVTDYLRDRLIALHRKDKEISRAQVYFRVQPDTSPDDKVCEIDLTIYGDSLFVHRSASSFEHAMRETLEELEKKIDEQLSRQNEPPDELTSTVKV